jgi:hypothetical protein
MSSGIPAVEWAEESSGAGMRQMLGVALPHCKFSAPHFSSRFSFT